MTDRALTPGTKRPETSNERTEVERLRDTVEQLRQEIGRLKAESRPSHETCEQPLAETALRELAFHAEAICSTESPSDMQRALTLMSITRAYKLLGVTTVGDIEANAQKAGEHRHGAAQDFVSFDPQGGVWIDMARYLRSPAGQAQLQELGGQKAIERQPCSHGNATGHCQHCLDAL